MNKERLLALADFIENIEDRSDCDMHFDMSLWGFETGQITSTDKWQGHCGTVGCIAGSTEYLFGDRKKLNRQGDWRDIEPDAQELLGLTKDQASELFNPWEIIFHDWDKITKKEAATVIRNFVETHRVDWHPVRHRLEA